MNDEQIKPFNMKANGGTTPGVKATLNAQVQINALWFAIAIKSNLNSGYDLPGSDDYGSQYTY